MAERLDAIKATTEAYVDDINTMTTDYQTKADEIAQSVRELGEEAKELTLTYGENLVARSKQYLEELNQIISGETQPEEPPVETEPTPIPE